MNRRQFIAAGSVAGAGLAMSPQPAQQAHAFSGAVDLPGGFVVPAGETWTLDPDANTTITVAANIVVNGTLRSRPAPGVKHTIRFVSINEAAIIGGHAMRPLAADVGLWVDGGVLDISGTPKVAWNRTGGDPSWSANDELLVMPTARGDFTVRPFQAGSPVPTVSSSLGYDNITHTFAAEVVNVTRNVVIEAIGGRAHVMFINIDRPQTLAFAELRNLGPSGKLGRYPLHIHMNGDGSNGSYFVGNVARNCGNHAFVTHASNGCDHSDSIAYACDGAAFWWDQGDRTDRVRWDRCGVIACNGTGFNLGISVGGSCVDSWAAASGPAGQAAILWSEHINAKPSGWLTDGFVAHNNRYTGIKLWNNGNEVRWVVRSHAYHNWLSGLEFGAYGNTYRIENCIMFGNGVRGDRTDLDIHAVGDWLIRDCWIDLVGIGGHLQSSTVDQRITTGRGWRIGSVLVDELVNTRTGAGRFVFESGYFKNDIKPSQVEVVSQASVVEFRNRLDPSFTLTP